MTDLKFSDKLFTFHWIIKNFSFIRPDRRTPLRSPYFSVNAYGNACVQLYPEGDLFSKECLLLEIKITNKLEDVPVDCELSGYDLNGTSLKFRKFEIANHRIWKFKKISESPAKNYKKTSLKSHTHDFDLHPAKFKLPPQKENEQSPKDTLAITFYFQKLKVPLGSRSSLGIVNDMRDIENLSRDLSQLFQSPQYSDLTLCAGDEIFSVHKAVLWARAPKFLNELTLKKKRESSEPIKMDIDPAVLKSLLQYLYSGKLQMDTAGFPVGLCTVAEAYDLVDLKQKLYVFPNESFASTCIKVDQKSFKWHVSFKFSGDKFYSPTFRTGCIPRSEFQLKLSISKTLSMVKDIKVCVRRLFPDKENPVFLHFKISIIGTGGRVKLSDVKQHYFLADEEWCFPCFEYKSSEWFMKQIRLGDTFCLKCDLSFSGGESCGLERTFCSSSSSIRDASDLTCFSHDMKQLYNIFLPKFSDFSLKIGEVKYPIHKAILCARSSVFSRMFAEDIPENKSDFIEISDIEPAILNILLVYIYSGIVEELNYENAVKLYVAADKYKILSLKSACAFFLKSKVKNVCELLLLADNYSVENLKTPWWSLFVRILNMFWYWMIGII